MSALGQVIQAYRQARGMSSRALAAAAGLAPQTVWLIEHGETQRPRPQNLMAIGRVLGVAPARLQALANGLPSPGHPAKIPAPQGAGVTREGSAARIRNHDDTYGRGNTMKWVTRSGVRMDRAAMAWLIRTKIDPEAEITILPEAEVMEYAEETGATPFHHPKAELRHTGTRTGFDALRVHFDLQDPALGLMALILRGAETNDKNLTQWSPGFAAIGSGLRNLTDDDETFIANMALVLDGLYRFCHDQLAPVARPTAERRSE
jgi:DNA-binding XRE family transcriptional regulator